MAGGDGSAPLRVELDLRAGAGRTLQARLQFRNDGPAAYRLLSWLTYPGGRIDAEDDFRVTLDGRPCDYIGIVKKRAPATEKDYLSLGPGAVLTRIVSLSDAYALPAPGLVEVVYAVVNPSLADGQPGDRLTSNPASIVIG